MVLRVAYLLMSLDDPLLCENSCYGYSCGLMSAISRLTSQLPLDMHARLEISLMLKAPRRKTPFVTGRRVTRAGAMLPPPLSPRERRLHGRLAETNTTTAGCKRCAERDTAWKNCLTSDGHGCSACKNVLDASSWTWERVRAHRRFDRDLVCPSCAERGYAPGKYDEHQCEECFDKLGSLKFDKFVLSHTKIRKNRLVFKECHTKLRCSKCKTARHHAYQGRASGTVKLPLAMSGVDWATPIVPESYCSPSSSEP